MADKVEKRMFQRLKEKISLNVFLFEKRIEAKTVDVSGRGLGIVLSASVPAWEDINLLFILSKVKDSLSVKARVIWVKKSSLNSWRAGVKIINPNLFLLSRILTA